MNKFKLLKDVVDCSRT